jgi:hypothetical protein
MTEIRIFGFVIVREPELESLLSVRAGVVQCRRWFAQYTELDPIWNWLLGAYDVEFCNGIADVRAGYAARRCLTTSLTTNPTASSDDIEQLQKKLGRVIAEQSIEIYNLRKRIEYAIEILENTNDKNATDNAIYMLQGQGGASDDTER